MQVHLVVFEAWNITRFVFVTNKRREIAGASELITHLDRRWVHGALADLFEGFDPGWRIEDHDAELLSAGAGGVQVLVRSARQARRLVTAVTVTALRQAPGLDVYGFVSAPFDWAERGVLAGAIREARAGLDGARVSRPGPDSRFLRLPVVDECATTGLPASVLVRQPGGDVEPRSAESYAKSSAYGRREDGDGLARLAELAGTTPPDLGRVVGYLQDEAEWVAVVYVDGNGLGEVLAGFEALTEGSSARDYADALRGFTEGLDDCARGALRDALDVVGPGAADDASLMVAPVLPLILGGDDVVLLCEGRTALRLTCEYLRAYERRTASASQVSGPLRRGGRDGGLTAAAGVAIVKPHHPFESAARLAYELMVEAKQVKSLPAACSALAFHVLYDSADVRWRRLRGDAQATSVVAQPYVVTTDVDTSAGWARGRHWDDLARRVAAVNARDPDGERLLPASQLHGLRQALFAGPDVADGRYANLLARYRDRGVRALGGDGDSLFWQEPAGRRVTGLLDAMDAAEFWGEAS